MNWSTGAHFGNALGGSTDELRLGTGLFITYSTVLSPNLIMSAGFGGMGEINNGFNSFMGVGLGSVVDGTVLPTISGVVYQDMSGGTLTTTDPRVSNATINLYRDGGDGVFEGKSAASDDMLVGTTTSDANGATNDANRATTDSTGATNFTYDQHGRLLTKRQQTGAVTLTTADAYGGATRYWHGVEASVTGGPAGKCRR